MKCRCCGSSIIPFLSLGKMPLVNSFLLKSELVSEKKYLLQVAYCPECHLAQLTKIVPPKVLFKHYLYFSSVSESLVEHFAEVAAKLKKKLKLSEKSLVLEIASNDGILLKQFQKLGIQVLGIDPAENIAKQANEEGVPTIADFFNLKNAKKLSTEKHVRADLIFGANVLAHVPEIIDFVQGLSVVLQPKGTAVFEFPYIKGLFEGKFDTIYHEHVFYYSLHALQNVFKKANLDIYDVEQTPAQGGSLMIFACHQGAIKKTKRIDSLLSEEKEHAYTTIESYRQIGHTVEEIKNKLLALLTSLKSEGKSIVGYGAAAKGVVLMNYFGIDGKLLDFIADKAPAKQNKYAPGNHLIVASPDRIMKDKPDYVVIFAWNIATEIMEQFSEYKKQGGKFIIPIPTPTVT